MEDILLNVINKLKEESEDKYNNGTNLFGVSDSLSEWSLGYSEGLDLAIEELEKIMKGLNDDKNIRMFK